MATYALSLILICMIPGVPATATTRMCKNCPHLVRGPSECMETQHCEEFCVTKVYHVNGEYLFRYSCAGGIFSSVHECVAKEDDHGNHQGAGPGREHRVCKECHTHLRSQTKSCSQYIMPTTHKHVTHAPTHKPVTHAPTHKPVTHAPTHKPVTHTTAIVSKECDKFGVIVDVVKENSVSYPETSTCPDSTHQPSEALVQKYCAAPNVTYWTGSVKVMENCPLVPDYTAIAAVTFGGSTVAGVFIKCEAGGFQAAIQTCRSQLKLYHVSARSTPDIPNADKFVILDWKQ